MPCPSSCLLLTGDRGSGKTTLCLRLRELAARAGVAPAGVLSLPVVDSTGSRTGLELLDAAGGQRRPLASCRGEPPPDFLLGERIGPRIGTYFMVQETLEWGIELVRRGLRTGGLVFLDEIGPLELDHGGGFAPLLDELNDPRLPPRVLVVRPALVDRLRARLSRREPRLRVVDDAVRDSLPEELLRLLLPGGASPAPPDLP